jgi:hypothetical protein
VKILLGTHHLELRAGSELFTAELAHSIQARGHEVAVFTFFKGKIAKLIEAWKKEIHRKLSVLNKNRYDAPHPSNFIRKLQRLFSVWR